MSNDNNQQNPNQSGLGYIDAGLTDDITPWDGSFSSINPGDYVFEVTEIKGGQAQSSGNPTMVLSYVAIQALDPINDDQVDREVIQSYSLNLTKKGTKRRLKSLLQALGVPIDNRGGFDPNKCIGARMVAEATLNSYKVENPTLGAEPEMRQNCKLIRERPMSWLDQPAEQPAQAAPARQAPAAAVQQVAPPAAVAAPGSNSRGRGRAGVTTPPR
jgi:hypothetical protein